MIRLEVVWRTFEAAKHPPGSEERAKANRSPITSEYMTSYRYLLVCYSADGSVAWTNCFRTKEKAEARRRSDLLASA